VEVFGDNGKGECFKTCDACRHRNRIHKKHKKDSKRTLGTQEEEMAGYEKDIELIKDDTICDSENVCLFIEKICRYVGDHSYTISRADKSDAIKGYSIDFEQKGHRMFLAFGDTWKRTQKFLDLPSDADITCPICFENLSFKNNAKILTCHECLVGVCGDCTIQQFIANRGVMVCCQCRHSVGEPKPFYQVAGMVEIMRRGLACNFRD
jgi:hypothetical protein